MHRLVVGALALLTLATGCRSVEGASWDTDLADEGGSVAAEPLATESPTPVSIPDDELDSRIAESTVEPAQDPGICTPLEGDQTSLVAVPPWEPGVTRAYKLSKTKTGTNNGTTTSTTQTIRATATVLEASADGIRIQWEQGDYELVGFATPATKRALAALNALPPLRVSYWIDADRLWSGIDDVEGLRRHALSVLESGAAGDDEATLALLADVYQNLSQSELEGSFLEYPLLLHDMEATLFDAELQSLDDSLVPNALGGPDIPATVTLQLADAIDAEGCAVVEVISVTDPDETARVFSETLESTFGADDDQTLDLGIQEMRITTRGRYDPGSAFFVEIASTESSVFGQFEGSASTTIVDVTDRPNER